MSINWEDVVKPALWIGVDGVVVGMFLMQNTGLICEFRPHAGHMEQVCLQVGLGDVCLILLILPPAARTSEHIFEI